LQRNRPDFFKSEELAEIQSIIETLPSDHKALWRIVDLVEPTVDGNPLGKVLLLTYVKAWQGKLDLTDDEARERCEDYVAQGHFSSRVTERGAGEILF